MRRKFTLIELIVVVGIIAILSGLMLPILAKARQKARSIAAKEQEDRRKLVEKTAKPPPVDGVYPVINAYDMQLQLDSSYQRVGMDVSAAYQLHAEGIIRFRPVDARPMLLEIPLPPDRTDLRDVVIQVRDLTTDQIQETAKIDYRPGGAYWTGTLDPSHDYQASVRYTTLGSEFLVYRLPQASQLDNVDIKLDAAGVGAYRIPGNILTPTSINGSVLEWKFKNVVSDRSIVVMIPGALSPLGRAMLLFRLLAVAVLLFGFGFWYMGELYRPGWMRSFRWGHFLLLASTYSLFFILFTVLSIHGALTTWQGLLVSAALSLPLLVLHVSRIVNFRFAVAKMLPLAAFTSAMVVNGVYGGDYRSYIYVFGITAVIA